MLPRGVTLSRDAQGDKEIIYDGGRIQGDFIHAIFTFTVWPFSEY